MDSRTPLIVESVRAADLLLGLDPWGSNWITSFRAKEAAKAAAGEGA
jgi:5-methyltetrahydrofolate--homocysteine methyltransferase